MVQQKNRACGAIHTFEQQLSLRVDKKTPPFGTLYAEMEVTEINNLRNLHGRKSYIVTCRQRISVPGCGWPLNPHELPQQTLNYPAALLHELAPKFPKEAQVRILDYSPKTMNTAVVTSNNVSAGQNSSVMQQYTSGSSYSQTNTYDVTANLGFAGAALNGGVSAGYSHSSTTTDEHSNSNSNSAGIDAQTAAGASMTIKDWGGYASLDLDRVVPTWSWLQEYPWDVASFNVVADGKIQVPVAVQQLLAFIPDTTRGETGDPFVFPPSHLSVNGIDFVSMVRWQVDMPKALIGPVDEFFSLSHQVKCYFGRHGITPASNATDPSPSPTPTASPSASPSPTPSPTVWVTMSAPAECAVEGDELSMPLLGLQAITEFEPGNGALIGFVPGQMLYGPDPAAGSFRVMSEVNNLYVKGARFTEGSLADAVMTTLPGISANEPAMLDVYFKVVEKNENITLYLKNWRTGAQGVILRISVNDGPAIIRHVDSREASDGSANLTTVRLCNRDLNSIEYFDYLKLGLNHISIAVVPSSDYTAGECGYAIRALAVG